MSLHRQQEAMEIDDVPIWRWDRGRRKLLSLEEPRASQTKGAYKTAKKITISEKLTPEIYQIRMNVSLLAAQSPGCAGVCHTAYQKFKNAVTLFIHFAQINNNGPGEGVNITHDFDLMATLEEVSLIDTNCIDPNELKPISHAPSRSSARQDYFFAMMNPDK
jgi:hypothetical protein